MPGIVIGVDPIAFSVGQFAVSWFGLTVIVAILTGFSLGLLEARRRGLDVDAVTDLGLWAIVGGMVGARLFHVLDHLTYYAANPPAIPALYEGGLSIYGGLAGGLVAAAIYSWRARLQLLAVLDAIAPGLLLAQAVGRLGCLLSGETQGVPANLPWAFTYVHPGSLAPELGVPGHPYSLYEILWDLLGVAVLWRLRDWRQSKGALFLLYAAYYSLGRFLLGFVRQELIVFWGLQQEQVLALIVLCGAALALAYLSRFRPVRLGVGPQGL